MKLRPTFLLLTLCAASPLRAADAGLPQIDPTKLGPEMLKSVEETYCGSAESQEKERRRLNDMQVANNAKLKVGSFAVYQIDTTRKGRASGRIVSQSSVLERWVVTAVKGDEATVETWQQGHKIETKTVSLKKGPFDQVIDRKQPLSCFYWTFYAKELGTEKVTAGQKTYETLHRRQAKLGNIDPNFYYAAGVPFGLAKYVEDIDFDQDIQHQEKLLVDASF